MKLLTSAEGAKLRLLRQAKRRDNYESSLSLLASRNVAYEVLPDKHQVVVHHKEHVIDYWPGSGRWQVRGTDTGARGVFVLLDFIGA